MRRPRADLLMWDGEWRRGKKKKKVILNEVTGECFRFESFADLPPPLLLLIHRYHFMQCHINLWIWSLDSSSISFFVAFFLSLSLFIHSPLLTKLLHRTFHFDRSHLFAAHILFPNFNLIFLFNVKSHDRLHNIWLLCWCCFHDESLMHAVNFIVFDHFPWSNFYFFFLFAFIFWSSFPFSFCFSISFFRKLNYKRITDNETRTTSTNSITINNLHNFLSLYLMVWVCVFVSLCFIFDFRFRIISYQYYYYFFFFSPSVAVSIDIWISDLILITCSFGSYVCVHRMHIK